MAKKKKKHVTVSPKQLSITLIAKKKKVNECRREDGLDDQEEQSLCMHETFYVQLQYLLKF